MPLLTLYLAVGRGVVAVLRSGYVIAGAYADKIRRTLFVHTPGLTIKIV
jgi:hypothetical protein